MHVDLQGSIASRIDTSWDTRDAEFEVIPLDSYVRAQGITKVAMLKVDVEGMELDVLDGAHETLAMTRRVAIETHGPEQHEGALNREPSIPTPIANGNAAPRPLIGDPPDAETRPR
jgi:hypothetical protein